MIAYSVFPTLAELAEMWPMWPMWLVVLLFAALWQASSRIENTRNKFYWMKRQADIRHRAHVEASK